MRSIGRVVDISVNTVLALLVDAGHAHEFMQGVANRLGNRVQFTVDGHKFSLDAVEGAPGMASSTSRVFVAGSDGLDVITSAIEARLGSQGAVILDCLRRLIDGLQQTIGLPMPQKEHPKLLSSLTNDARGLHIAKATFANPRSAIGVSQFDPRQVSFIRQPHVDADQAVFAKS